MDYLLHHFLRGSARRFPSKEALVHGEERLSYADLDRRTSQLAHALLGAGLEPSQRVGIILEKNVNEAISIFAVSKASGVFVPVNHLLFPEQVSHIVNDCAIQGLILSEAKIADLEPVFETMPSLKFLISVDGDERELGSLRVFSLGKVFEEASGETPECACISNDLGAFLYTSGSTGRPKGVVLTHANLMAGAHIVSTYLELGAEDRLLSALPFSFDYGLNQLTTMVQQGGTLVLLNFKFPNEIVQCLLNEKITGFAGVPPLWSLVTSPRSSIFKNEVPQLRYLTNSGGAITPALLERMQKAFPDANVVLMYGLTEAFRSTYLPPAELEKRPTSMGKAIPDTEIFLVNDKGELCQPGEVGELVHRGPTVSLGYWNRPEATAEAIRPHPFLPPEVAQSEMVCYSGDLVKMDEEGFLYFVSRRDATIKSSGHRISPQEVEEVVISFGNIQDVAVVGVPDEALGQAIKAYIVPHEGQDVDPLDLRGFCSEKMPRYMIPRDFEFLGEMPKTSSGKVNYKELREHAAQGATEKVKDDS